jgi:hypothetical protein
MDLKDHFSQDATNDIESVFLISKSNCAFVNYKSAAACVAALARFHDSRFQGVRVVCRLRKGFTAPGSGPGSASASASGVLGAAGQSNPRPRDDVAPAPATDPGPVLEDIAPDVPPATGNDPAPARVVDRYFIVKSLTTEDLELSKQSGIWATQSHNEVSMNQAYEVSMMYFHLDPTIADFQYRLDHRLRIFNLLRQQVGRVLWIRPHDVADQRR